MNQLLSKWQDPRPQGAANIITAQAAAGRLRRRFGWAAGSLTWQPTVLVNETLLRIIRHPREYDSQGHFFAMATAVMRGLLVDYCRQRSAIKRGGDRIRIELHPDMEPLEAREGSCDQLESLLEALDRLAVLDPRKARVVQMRILWGLSNQKTATALDISRATVERDWRFARAWLKRETTQSGI